ncbi:unnamed protein product, partial [Amoebophrya sp. A25]
ISVTPVPVLSNDLLGPKQSAIVQINLPREAQLGYGFIVVEPTARLIAKGGWFTPVFARQCAPEAVKFSKAPPVQLVLHNESGDYIAPTLEDDEFEDKVCRGPAMAQHIADPEQVAEYML